MNRCVLSIDNNSIAINAPYDAGFVAELKSVIPSNERRWKGENKSWVVATRHGATLQNLCMKYYNEMPLLPVIANIKPATMQKILDVRYIGTTKARGGDERSAYGWYNNGWNVLLSEPVLRAWFDAPATPDEMPTLYSVLGVRRESNDDEIKSGYRRMVFQWHPDRCKEMNAQEQFLAIQQAYEVLSKKRDRYDAGLAFELSLKNTKNQNIQSSNGGYRSPLRCGLIMCEGVDILGIFNVSKIFAWEDVRDSFGRTLVVSWGKDDNHFTEVWA